jgi:hypothetical protein
MSPVEYRDHVLGEIHRALLAGKASKDLLNMVCETLEVACKLLDAADEFYDPALDDAGDQLATCFEVMGDMFE